ncbi:hypothetical protein ARMSODRAFT_1015306 [Armillaria solidipes]|uniref:Uncharacterized protein n=1 Tax=Armillaria solidipes TaxID=1076256 RepID=A0A2H3BVX5_9AGAR|nr:hypothetical protein ARMSODRAFT_1015306 [Armillaria solidipes]
MLCRLQPAAAYLDFLQGGSTSQGVQDPQHGSSSLSALKMAWALHSLLPRQYGFRKLVIADTVVDTVTPDPKDIVFIIVLVSLTQTAMSVIQSSPPGNGNDNQTGAPLFLCSCIPSTYMHLWQLRHELEELLAIWCILI